MHSPYVYERMSPGHEESGGHPVAVYDLNKKKIIVNPYAFKDKAGEINWAQVKNSLSEELIHAVDHQTEQNLGFPMSKMHKKTAEKLDIFASKAETGMSAERYNYLLKSEESYAKLVKVKQILFQQQERGEIEAFDSQGKIKPEVLQSLIKGDSNAFKILKLDQENKKDVELLDPFQTLNHINFFNQLVQVDLPAKTSTQTA